MAPLSYTVSQELSTTLKDIDSLRQTILLTLLPHKTFRRLHFEAAVSRMYNAAELLKNPVTKKQITNMLANPFARVTSGAISISRRYQISLEYIYQQWFAVRKPITLKTVFTLYEMMCRGKSPSVPKSYGQILEYLQVSQDHPVIQAAVAHGAILALEPFANYNEIMAFLSSYLFLYNFGYDGRNMIVLEEYWKKTPKLYLYAKESIGENANMTLWIEYFAKGVQEQLLSVSEHIASNRYLSDLPASYWELTDRQKAILSLLIDPDVTVTNRKVQKKFNISQITASRDLAKLAALGLLLHHGKGRSVYYTRA